MASGERVASSEASVLGRVPGGIASPSSTKDSRAPPGPVLARNSGIGTPVSSPKVKGMAFIGACSGDGWKSAATGECEAKLSRAEGSRSEPGRSRLEVGTGMP